MVLGLHPRERKSSVTRRLGGLLVGVAAKAPCALLVCPSAQGRADRGLGGLPPGWRTCPPAQPHPCQTV